MEPLSDPLSDRVVKTLNPPPHKFLSQSLLWKNDVPDYLMLRDHLLQEGRITKTDFI